MKRKIGMRIVFLAVIIFVTALLVSSASASLGSLPGLPGLSRYSPQIDHFQFTQNIRSAAISDVSIPIGTLETAIEQNATLNTINGNSSEGMIITPVGPRPGIGIILDEKGVPSVRYSSSEIYKNPLTVSQTAMKYYVQYQAGDKSARRFFLNCSDWLVENAANRDNYSVWIYNIPSLTYGIPLPWISGLAQGAGIQVLLVAYNLTKDDKYMIVAGSALKSFNKEVKLDGVTYKDKEGWCYEEYASPHWNKEPRVLNGFGYALFGINDYYKATRDENARKLFELGFSDFKAHLADYDTGSWTNYDALGLRATPAYHHMHVSILEILYNITGDSSIKLYRDKWRGYELKQGFGASKSLLEMDKEIPLLKIYPMIE